MAADPTTAPGAARVRPDVLGYPNPTTARYLVLAAALLASGLYVGSVLHTQTMGEQWTATTTACEARYGGGADVMAMLANNRQYRQCTADVERDRVLVTVATAAVIGALAVGLMWLAPLVVVRRRGLQPLPAGLAGAAGRFGELAAEAGVRGRVAPLLGRTDQRDAFSFGAPGRYRVALPRAVAVRFRDPATFDPLVGHELAHVVHRDVSLAWLTRLIWVVLVPALALPVLVGLLSGDLSAMQGYWWRTGLLALSVALLSADLLRTREYGADLRAARLGGGLPPVLGLVRRARSPEASLRNRVLAKHPSAEDRVAVLEEPSLLARTGFRDGFTGAFLTGLAVPLVVSAITPLLAELVRADLAYLVGAATMGPLLAGAVGLGVSRAALFARLRGEDVPCLGVAAGVGLGLMLGQAASLQGGLTRPAWLLVSGVAGAGAAAVAAGLSHVWADAAPRLPGVRVAWVAALVGSSLLFATLLWSTTLFQTAAETGGWPLARAAVTTTLSPWWVCLLVLGLGTATGAALWLRAGSPSLAPPWLVEGPARVPWPGAAGSRLRDPLLVGAVAGLVAALAIAGYRVVAGPAASDAAAVDRFQEYQWLVGLAAASTVLPAVVQRPASGAGAAVLATPVAVLVATVGFLALNQALGGSLDLAGLFLPPAMGVALYALLLLAGPAALLASLLTRLRRPGRAPGMVAPGMVATGAGAVLASAALSAAVLVGGSSLVSGAPGDLADPLRDDVSETTDPALALIAYEQDAVPSIERGYAEAVATAQRIWTDPTTDPVTKSALTRRDVVVPLEALATAWDDYSTGAAEVDDLHRLALTALGLSAQRYAVLADAAGTVDQTTLAHFAELGEEEVAQWNRWRSERLALAEHLLSDGG